MGVRYLSVVYGGYNFSPSGSVVGLVWGGTSE